MTSEYYFVIVGPKDNPLYETDASWQVSKDKKVHPLQSGAHPITNDAPASH
jgi:hypothetical protein